MLAAEHGREEAEVDSIDTGVRTPIHATSTPYVSDKLCPMPI
jgi:hypothetical protein